MSTFLAFGFGVVGKCSGNSGYLGCVLMKYTYLKCLRNVIRYLIYTRHI